MIFDTSMADILRLRCKRPSNEPINSKDFFFLYIHVLSIDRIFAWQQYLNNEKICVRLFQAAIDKTNVSGKIKLKGGGMWNFFHFL